MHGKYNAWNFAYEFEKKTVYKLMSLLLKCWQSRERESENLTSSISISHI